MSVTSIPQQVKLRLWGKAAGCCQYENCNKPLFYDSLTKAEFNTSYIAHIYADEPGGPRWHPQHSVILKKDEANLMLLCDEHHRLIDKAQVEAHPAERLFSMKKKHEDRISLMTGLTPDKRSHIILYGANVGVHGSPLTYTEAAASMLPARYPAEAKGIELGIKNSSLADNSNAYWTMQEEQLCAMFNQAITPLKGNHEVQHFSVFGLAPMPLLIKLGTLLSDIYEADVYQRHREPTGWKWADNDYSHKEFFTINSDIQSKNDVALNLSLSANINNDRISAVLGPECSIYTISHASPNNDFLRTQELLRQLRTVFRSAFNNIKKHHGQQTMLHVFPAMPVAASIELGRVWMPKADLSMIIYDQNKNSNSFSKTLTIK